MEKSLFKVYLEAAKAQDMEFSIGETYYLNNKQIEYLGTIKDNPDIKYHSSMGDALLDKPTLLFKWKEGDSAISSYGRKGHIIALGKKEASKSIKKSI